MARKRLLGQRVRDSGRWLIRHSATSAFTLYHDNALLIRATMQRSSSYTSSK